MEMYEIGLPGLSEDQNKFVKEVAAGRLQKTIQKIADEVARAQSIHGSFHSLHEGHSVLEEEYDELWDEIKRNPLYIPHLKKEAVHTAAMAFKLLQFIEEHYPNV